MEMTVEVIAVLMAAGVRPSGDENPAFTRHPRAAPLQIRVSNTCALLA